MSKQPFRDGIAFSARPDPGLLPNTIIHDSLANKEQYILASSARIKELEQLIESLTRGRSVGKNENLFHFFPSLPLELRNIIWKMALPGPRMIEIFTKHERACQVGKCPDHNFCERQEVGEIHERQPEKSYSPLWAVSKEARHVHDESFEHCLTTFPLDKPDSDMRSVADFLMDYEPSCQKHTDGIKFIPKQDTIYIRNARNGIPAVFLNASLACIIGAAGIESLAIDDYLLANKSFRDRLFETRVDRNIDSGVSYLLTPLFPRLEHLVIFRNIIRKDKEGHHIWGKNGLEFGRESRVLDLVGGYAKKVEIIQKTNELWRNGNGRWDMPQRQAWDSNFDGYALAVEAHQDLPALQVAGSDDD